MIGDKAGRMRPTDPGTGVSALVVDASLYIGTLRVDSALGLALYVGVASIVPDTGT